MANHYIARIVCTGTEIEAHKECSTDIGIDMYLCATSQGSLNDSVKVCLDEGDVFTFVACEVISGAKYDLSTLMLVCEHGKIRVSPESLVDESYAFEVIVEGV
jgi:hypothetical protein